MTNFVYQLRDDYGTLSPQWQGIIKKGDKWLWATEIKGCSTAASLLLQQQVRDFDVRGTLHVS